LTKGTASEATIKIRRQPGELDFVLLDRGFSERFAFVCGRLDFFLCIGFFLDFFILGGLIIELFGLWDQKQKPKTQGGHDSAEPPCIADFSREVHRFDTPMKEAHERLIKCNGVPRQATRKKAEDDSRTSQRSQRQKQPDGRDGYRIV
jgi:hypothetical protein